MMNNKLRCILIDDEESNIHLLERMLKSLCPQLEVMTSETDALQGLKRIKELDPDLLFLDIDMPGLNGFELLKQMEPISFEVIFVTAHSEYALMAFDVQAIGYLTKPIDEEKLIKVVQASCDRIQIKDTNINIFSSIENKMTHRLETKIQLNTLNGIIFIKEEEVIYCESNGRYTYFHMIDGNKIVVSKAIGDYEKILPEGIFVRIHDRFIINLNFVNEYAKGRGGEVTLNSMIKLPVSIHRKEKLLLLFDQWLRR
jgi:two-component system LytT family response regulator